MAKINTDKNTSTVSKTPVSQGQEEDTHTTGKDGQGQSGSDTEAVAQPPPDLILGIDFGSSKIVVAYACCRKSESGGWEIDRTGESDYHKARGLLSGWYGQHLQDEWVPADLIYDADGGIVHWGYEAISPPQLRPDHTKISGVKAYLLGKGELTIAPELFAKILDNYVGKLFDKIVNECRSLGTIKTIGITVPSLLPASSRKSFHAAITKFFQKKQTAKVFLPFYSEPECAAVGAILASRELVGRFNNNTTKLMICDVGGQTSDFTMLEIKLSSTTTSTSRSMGPYSLKIAQLSSATSTALAGSKIGLLFKERVTVRTTNAAEINDLYVQFETTWKRSFHPQKSPFPIDRNGFLMTSDELEEIFNAVLGPIAEAGLENLKSSGLSMDEIDYILLTGASSQSDYIQDELRTRLLRGVNAADVSKKILAATRPAFVTANGILEMLLHPKMFTHRKSSFCVAVPHDLSVLPPTFRNAQTSVESCTDFDGQKWWKMAKIIIPKNILMKAENGIIRKDFWQVFNLPSTVAGDIEDGFSVSLVISSAVTSSSEFVPLEKFDNMPRSDIHIGREQITARSRRLYRDERKGRRGYWVDFYVLISIEIAMDLHIKIRSAADGMPPKARHVKTTSRSPMRDPMDVPFADLQDFPVKTLYDQRTDLTYIWAVEERNAQAEQSSQRGSSISL